jgi:tetratricopeptide (TPR) repeat protein
VPRVSTPRLASPRSANNRSVAYSGYRWGTYNSCSSTIWGGYWGYGSSSYWGIGYSSYGGWYANYCGLGCWNFDPYCWNIGVLSPYSAFRFNYWNNCYRNCYWNNWSTPNALPSSYWWYPTTTYCPTYLYVPSSVVVIEEEVVEPTDGGTITVSAGGLGGVAGLARDSEEVAVKEDKPASSMSLAEEYVQLGDYFFQAGQYDTAANAYSNARNHMPNDASIHFVLADAIFAQGDYHYAAFLIAEGARLDARIVSSDVDKRDFYGDKKDFEQQLEALQNYCSKKPYDAWAQLVLGYNLQFSDRPTRAIAAFRRVLELDRGNPTAQAFLDNLVPARKMPLEDAGKAKKVESEPKKLDR